MRASRLVTGLTLVAGVTSLSALAASAADLPRKAVAAPVATLGMADWSGFYLGAHAGYGSALSRGTYDDSSDFGPIDFHGNGFIGGAQAGYNWQYGRLVYGVEVDGTWGKLDESRIDNEGDTQRIKTNFLGSARFRSGAAIDNLFIFGTIGFGYAQSKFTVSGSDTPSPASVNLNSWGMVSGFGAEYALTPNWSLRGEYLYYAMSKRSDIPNLTNDSDATDFVKAEGIHVARIAANYRFNGGQAVAAATPPMNWTGLYIGAHGGYGRSRITGVYDEAGDNGSFNIDPTGAVGGLQIGYNFQNGAIVYGLEADGSWSGMRKERIDTEGDSEKLKTTSLASIRGRVGVAADNRLYYITGGWGMIKSKLDVVEGGLPASQGLRSGGLVIGSGVDWAFNPNWSVRVEGLTYFANKSKFMPDLTGDSEPQDYIKQNAVTVLRAGLNYRFGGP